MQDRKYFDSGDYALSKAGKAPQNTVGTAIPSPEKYVQSHIPGALVSYMASIPHATSPVAVHALSVSPTNNNAASPIKESPLADPIGVTVDDSAFSEEKVVAEAGHSEEMKDEVLEHNAVAETQDLME